MKKWFGFFHKHTAPTTTEAVKPEPIIGITEAEYNNIHAQLIDKLEAGINRKKVETTKPSRYMAGIMDALSILESIVPHNLQEEA